MRWLLVWLLLCSTTLAQDDPLEPSEPRLDRRVLIVDRSKQGSNESNVVSYWVAPKDIELVSVVLNPPNAVVRLKGGKEITLTKKEDVQALSDFMRWHELNWPSWVPNQERELYHAQKQAWELLKTNRWLLVPMQEAVGGQLVDRWSVYAVGGSEALGVDVDPIKAIDKARVKTAAKVMLGVP